MKILILTGGNSSERRISFLSAKNVEEALEQNGHKVTIYDLRRGYEPLKNLSKNFDILFPVLHGEEGEGGGLHKFLSSLGKPIVGTRNFNGMKAGWFKIPFKKYCDMHGIKTAKWKIVKTNEDIVKFGFPCVVKTSSGGSSREVAILKTKNDLSSYSLKKIISLGIPIYAEEFLPGIEVTCGILNGKALPLLEIVPPQGKWFSYKNKYDNSTQEIPFAPSLSPSKQIEVQKIALELHNAFNLGTYSRSDFVVHQGEPYALEINTIPGLTAGSLMPKQAKAAGMSFNEFIEELIKKAS